MANDFMKNPNKKDLNGTSISYTTFRSNYPNDKSMRDGGGIPKGVSEFSGLKLCYEQVLFIDDELSQVGGTMNGVYFDNATYKAYNLINCHYDYHTGDGMCDYSYISFKVGDNTMELYLCNDPRVIK